MLKVNTTRIAEFTWSSPEGEIIGAAKRFQRSWDENLIQPT